VNYFEGLLVDRKNPYEIDLELMVRKLLEKSTSYEYEIRKNDKYDYDLIVYKYFINGGEWESIPICFIEVEVSETWSHYEYPGHWKSDSFLARKVLIEYGDGFTRDLKKNADKTAYVIFNKSFSNAIAQRMTVIADFKLEYNRVVGKGRNDHFLRIKKDNDVVKRGLKDVLNFLYKFIIEMGENGSATQLPVFDTTEYDYGGDMGEYNGKS
jgi:hypothetical protein